MDVGDQALVSMARRRATKTITAKYGEDMLRDMDGLIGLLAEEDDSIRFCAVTCLGILGAPAKGATSPLAELQDRELKSDIRVMIKWALRRVNV